MTKRSMWHSSAGRILSELLYGQDSAIIIESERGCIEVSIAKLSQRLQMRSQAMIENLEWLESQDLLEAVRIGRRSAFIILKPSRAPYNKEL